VSPAELAVVKDRLNKGQQPQTMARDALLSGNYYAYEAKIAYPKSFKGWTLPTNTPASGAWGACVVRMQLLSTAVAVVASPSVL
jgi:hypothetical protein